MTSFNFPAVVISDPKFVGPHSVMKVALASALRFASHFSLEVRPESSDGTLLYLGQTRDAKHLDFFSLALRYRPTINIPCRPTMIALPHLIGYF